MSNNQEALDQIEVAFRAEPFCPCGEPTTVVARGGGLQLVCVTRAGPRRRPGRWLDRVDVAHVSRTIVEASALDRVA